MNRKNKKPVSPDEHFEALSQLLTQLKTHLTDSAGKKGTYGDYLRLLEFYRDGREEQVKELIIAWVDNENHESEPVS